MESKWVDVQAAISVFENPKSVSLMQVPNNNDLDKVSHWLQSLGLQDYVDAMRAHHIDDWALTRLNEADLREIGVVSVGHRKRLMAAIVQRSNSCLLYTSPSPRD